MIYVTTEHGTYRGKTVDTIARRIYGRKAEFWGSNNSTSPEFGMIVKYLPECNAHSVLATVYDIDDHDPWK